MSQQNNVDFKQLNKRLITLSILALFLSITLIHSLIKPHTTKQKSHYKALKLALPITNEYGKEINAEEEEEYSGWRTLVAQKGDNLGSIFKRAKISQRILQEILYKNHHTKLLTSIRPKQKIKILMRDNQLQKLVITPNKTQYLVVSRVDKTYRTQLKSRAMTYQNQYITATIKGSLYGTAKRMNIPYQLIRQMTDIFTWQIDFAKDVHVGDQFSLVYKGSFIDGELVNIGQILAVTYNTKTRSYQAIRHTSANGSTDYYTPEGHGLRKAFSRYPLRFSHISSTFSLSRRHPILHYNRPHKGIDLAAPIGTPIRATGDGRIVAIGRQGAYGNMIKLSHSKMYSSLYGHLLKFQRGLSRGDFVKRGQIIGYVGQSGLASGPHCHYEFHVNRQPRNPTTVDLPQSEGLSSREMASFKQNANTLLAQLKLYQEATLAAAKTTPTRATS